MGQFPFGSVGHGGCPIARSDIMISLPLCDSDMVSDGCQLLSAKSSIIYCHRGGSVAEWLAYWTQAHRRARVQIAVTTLSGNSLRQTVHTYRVSVHQAAKLLAALLRVARVTAAWRKVMAAYRRVYDSRHLQADCQAPGSAPQPYA